MTKGTFAVVVSSLLLGACAEGIYEAPEYDSRAAVATRWFEAYKDCKAGAADCNVCANDVRGQLEDAFDGAMRWDSASWSFNWERNYAPSNREPDNVFGEHVQGFARTNRDPYRFVGSYSADDGSDGGIFFVHRDAGGAKSLQRLHTTRHRHPSGVAVLGKYVAFSDATDKVRLIDMDRIDTAHLLEFRAAGASRSGGGLGLARLANGGYLLVVAPKGGSEGDSRSIRFYRLEGSLTRPTVVSAGVWTYTQPASWSGNYKYSENLTVIPECGTGDLYVLTTGGDNRFLGRGWWLLSKVVDRPAQGLGLAPIKAYGMDQTQADCHLRSTGSAWIEPDGDLQLLCHERAAVNGWLDGSSDELRFKHGINYAE